MKCCRQDNKLAALPVQIGRQEPPPPVSLLPGAPSESQAGLSFGAGGRGQFLPASPSAPSSTCVAGEGQVAGLQTPPGATGRQAAARRVQ